MVDAKGAGGRYDPSMPERFQKFFWRVTDNADRTADFFDMRDPTFTYRERNCCPKPLVALEAM
jgi:hypothetical protein